jgi:hypothetical protein
MSGDAATLRASEQVAHSYLGGAVAADAAPPAQPHPSTGSEPVNL